MTDRSLPLIKDTDGSTQQELLRRFPEIELIDSESVQFDVGASLVEHDMADFWIAPAASSKKYHSLFSTAEHGLWAHTKMVFTVYQRFAPSLVQQGRITEYEADLGRAAVLLHDYRKHGEAGWPENEYATDDHDLVMADLIREETDLDDRVAAAVASHMGPWNDGPAPETPLQHLVHYADLAGSSKNVTCGVYEPAEELRELYPIQPGADL